MKAHQTSNGACIHFQIINYWQNGLMMIMVIVGHFLNWFLAKNSKTSVEMLLVQLHFHITLIIGNHSSM
jgi:hypothetical protein